MSKTKGIIIIRKITKDRILDLGTGPATQAIQLSKRGLKVTDLTYLKLLLTEQEKLTQIITIISIL
jgi:hypothetical protein